MTEKKVNEPEDRGIEIIHPQQKRIKKLKKMNKASKILVTIPKGLIICITGFPDERRKTGTKKLLKNDGWQLPQTGKKT